MGFDWVRGTIAMIESGRRRLTIEEFFCLPQILETAGAGDLWLADLLHGAGDVHVYLTPLTVTRAAVLESMLAAESRLGRESAAAGPVTDAPEIPGVAEVRTLARRWWPKERGMTDPGILYPVALASRGDAESKAARVLRVSPVAVALAAKSLWDRSLTEERDARVAERIGETRPPARQMQALRASETRRLLGELRRSFGAEFGQIRKKRRGR
jgi:hypothetical protein